MNIITYSSFIMLVILFLSLVVSVAVYFRIRNKISFLEGALATEKSKRQSQSTRYGQLSEQFIPLLSSYDGDPKQFRFLGSPVDGIGFEEDKIIIAEFKVADSKLTPKQRKIRDLINNGNVEFREIRIDENNNINKIKSHSKI